MAVQTARVAGGARVAGAARQAGRPARGRRRKLQVVPLERHARTVSSLLLGPGRQRADGRQQGVTRTAEQVSRLRLEAEVGAVLDCCGPQVEHRPRLHGPAGHPDGRGATTGRQRPQEGGQARVGGVGRQVGEVSPGDPTPCPLAVPAARRSGDGVAGLRLGVVGGPIAADGDAAQTVVAVAQIHTRRYVEAGPELTRVRLKQA